MHKRILVAVDGSSTSNATLEEAIRLAREWRAALRIVHVIDSPYSYPEVLYGEVAAELETMWQAWRHAGEDILAQAGARARQAQLEPEVVLLQGEGRRASAAVVKEAERWGADLIVIGARGCGPERSLLGSVAEGVARSAPVSVFLVRESQR
jgi:nucleotide-binding universal stress UspA family protein